MAGGTGEAVESGTKADERGGVEASRGEEIPDISLREIKSLFLVLYFSEIKLI